MTNHCPVCMAEYPFGVTKCVDDGAALDPGPAPAIADDEGDEDWLPPRGSMEVVAPAGAEPEASDLFAQEERLPRRMVLAEVVPEDAGELVDALVREGIGARIGAATDNGGVLVLIHEVNLPDAQGILVDFTDDTDRVDDIRYADDREDLGVRDPGDGDYVEVTSPRQLDAPAQLERLLGAGIDVRVQPPANGSRDPNTAVTLMVPAEDLDRARATLGITL